METGFMNRIIGLVLALVVGGLLVGGLLIPTMTATSDAQTITKTNDYGIFASASDEDLEISCKLNADDPTKWDWTVNGDTIQFSVSSEYKPVIITDNIHIGLDTTGTITVASSSNARFTNQEEISITLSEGTLTGTSSVNGEIAHSYSQTYDWAFYASETGDYRSFYLTTSQDFDVYYTDINDIYGANFTFTTNKFYSFHGAAVKYNNTELTATVNADHVQGTEKMNVIDVARNTGDYTFVVDNSGTDYTVHPWTWIVPAQAQCNASANSPIYTTLFGVVSLLGIVALVVVAANGIRNKY